MRVRSAICALLAVHATPVAAQEVARSFGPDDAARRMILRTTTDIGILAPTVTRFLATRPDLAVTYEQWGSNDLFALTEADCRSAAPGADLVISSGVHQMVKLVNDGCAAPWRSDVTAALPAELSWRDELFGVSREPAVMVYNRDLVPPDEVPLSRFDLLDLLRPADSAYSGRVATYDIEQSGLGYLFAYVDSQEASTFGALMESFARTGAIATCCSSEIIAGVSDGTYLIAYNVLGSYAQSAAASDPALGIVEPADYTVVLSRAALLPGPVPDPDAGAFLDFLLSPEGLRSLAESHLSDIARDDGSAIGGRRVPIELGPSLLVAMDQAKSRRFVARWRQTFSGTGDAPQPPRRP